MRGWSAEGKVIDGQGQNPAQAVLMQGDGITAVPAVLPGWHADLVQLGRGRLQACGVHLPLDASRLTHVHLCRKAVLRATIPRDQVAVIFAPSPSSSIAIGARRIEGDRCVAAGATARLEIIVPEKAALLIVHLRAERRGPQNGGPRLPASGQIEFRRLPADRASLLTACSERMAGLCRPETARAEIARLQAELDGQARSAIGTLFAGAAPMPSEADEGTVRRQAVSRACAHIDGHLRKPLALMDLCAAAGVGTRTLEYGFREIYDVGPMAYVRSIRLSRVYRDLADPRSADESVTETARRWCFTHMGQFSKDYRIQFGESPSVTLKRSRQGEDWGCGTPAWGEGGRA